MAKSNSSSTTKRQLIEKSNSAIFISIMVAAMVVSFSIVILNFLWNLSGHYSRVESEKSQASAILKDNVEKIETLQASYNVLEAGDVKSSTILDALPSKYDFPALATTIESLVSISGLSMDSFSGKDLESAAVQELTEPAPVEIKFSISVSGSYDDIQNFVDNMARTIRPMQIESIELRGSDESMRATVQVVTYYQPAISLEVEVRTIE